MHVWGISSDWFLQLVVTAFVLAFGLLHLVKNTASKYFLVDANFDESDSLYSHSSTSSSDFTPSKMPGVIATQTDSCAVCGNSTTKHCSRCKFVKYCSAACQSSHWNSGHKKKCKDFQLSGKFNAMQSASLLGGKKSSTAVSLVPASGTSKIPKQSKKILFPYEEFVEFFNWKKLCFPPCGLLNCGNSCFANVILQCLACTRPLVAYLLEKGHQRECRRNDWCFLCEFQTHVERSSRNMHPFSPINILSRLTNIGGNLGYGKQEDAHEFMRFAIDSMQSVCLDEFGGEKTVHRSSQETTLIQHIFGGRLQSQVICTKCNNVSNRFENMMDLTVEIQGDAASLEECLDQFTVRECLHGDNMYKCDGCNDYVQAWKRLSVQRAPNILTIALKRFQSGRFGKLNKRVTFPETLGLTPYMSEAGDGNDVYKLYAVVVHVDTLNASFFGHYICYTKDFQGNWYRIDDCKVTGVDLDEVLSQGAYMLLYSRVCARPSCLYTSELLRAEEHKMMKVAHEGEHCSRHVEFLSAAESTDMAGVSSFPSDNSSEQVVSDREDLLSSIPNSEDVKEDSDIMDFEASSSASKDVGNGCGNAAEGIASPVEHVHTPVSGVSSLADTYSTEASILKPEPSRVSDVENGNEADKTRVSDVENGNEADKTSAEHSVLMDYLTDVSVSMQKHINENGETHHKNYLSPLSSDEVPDEKNANSRNKLVKVGYGKGLQASSGIEDAKANLDDGNSACAKLKPLFSPGFLVKPQRRKSTKRERKAPEELRELALACDIGNQNNGFSKTILGLQNGCQMEDGAKPHVENSGLTSSFLQKQGDYSPNEEKMVTSESVNLCNGGGAQIISHGNTNDFIKDDRALVVGKTCTDWNHKLLPERREQNDWMEE